VLLSSYSGTKVSVAFMKANGNLAEDQFDLTVSLIQVTTSIQLSPY
jgi:hypothetical protein